MPLGEVRDVSVVGPPAVAGMTIDLDFISVIMSPMTVSSALVFSGEVDEQRFVQALRDTGITSPHIFGVLSAKKDMSGLQVVPRTSLARSDDEAAAASPEAAASNPTGVINVEVCDARDVPFAIEKGDENQKIVDKLIPQNVHIKMIRVDLAMALSSGLPIAAFRLTQFQGHFVIGYRLNHVFFDQAGVVSLFHSLSLAYRHGAPPEKLVSDAAMFLPRAHLAAGSPAFPSKEAFAAAAPSGYNAEPLDFSSMKFGPPVANVTRRVSRACVDALRSQAEHVSSNDVIHAVLLKALAACARNRAASAAAAGDEGLVDVGKEAIRVMYAHNMRGPTGVSPWAHGDYVRVECTATTVAEAESLTVAQLARMNRQQLAARSADHGKFVREVQWFRDFKSFSSTGFPNMDFSTDPNCVIATNWSSFPYEAINFSLAISSSSSAKKAAGPETLLMENPPMMAQGGGFVRISFEYARDGKRDLVVSFLSQHKDAGEAFDREGASINLFQ